MWELVETSLASQDALTRIRDAPLPSSAARVRAWIRLSLEGIADVFNRLLYDKTIREKVNHTYKVRQGQIL